MDLSANQDRLRTNLGVLCQQLVDFATSASIELPDCSSDTVSRLADSLYLSHSTSDKNFSSICESRTLLSATALGRAAAENRSETEMGTLDFVFLYVAPFRRHPTTYGLLFSPTIEVEHQGQGIASPFDSGGLAKYCIIPNGESPRDFLSRHELPLFEHRQYLCRTLNSLFTEPDDYCSGTQPRLCGPIGLIQRGPVDPRVWTHEVRIAERLSIRTSHLQAVFAPANRVAIDPAIEALFVWCNDAGVDIELFDPAGENDFSALRAMSLSYFRRKLY